jgi:hypothetical protein
VVELTHEILRQRFQLFSSLVTATDDGLKPVMEAVARFLPDFMGVPKLFDLVCVTRLSVHVHWRSSLVGISSRKIMSFLLQHTPRL